MKKNFPDEDKRHIHSIKKQTECQVTITISKEGKHLFYCFISDKELLTST